MTYAHLQKIPEYVKKVQEMLLSGGGKPYIVGGAVRDLLMGKTPHDWDIASDLTPPEVIEILNDHHIPVVDKLGNNFGVVVGVFDGNPVEIATFRSDIYGSDAHRPESVSYCKSIDADLARRDFTMNAMAMDGEGYIVDPYNGQEDIKKRIIRPVGDAEKRYKEDPLRMYRACRFVAQLGFIYSEDVGLTPYFVRKDFWKETNAENLPVERVKHELEKLLVSKYPGRGLNLMMSSGLMECPCILTNSAYKEKVYPLKGLVHLKDLPQNPEYHMYDAWKHTLAAVHNVPPDLLLRYTMLFHDAGKGLEGIRGEKNGQPTDHRHEKESGRIAEEALKSLGYSNGFINKAKNYIYLHMSGFAFEGCTIGHMKRWLKRQSKFCRNTNELVEKVDNLEKVFCADMAASKNDVERIISLREDMKILNDMAVEFPVHSSDLNIKGNKVKKIVSDKMDMKTAYETLLTKVQDGVVVNEETELENSLKKQMQRLEEKSKKGKER